MNFKIRATTAALMCTALLVTGCGGKGKNNTANVEVVEDSNVTAPGELPVVKNEITLRVGVFSDTNIQDYETNAYSKFLQEKTGIKFNFDVLVNPAQKLKVMLAADDEVPEVLFHCGLTDDVLMKYGINGTNTILDLGEYMDNYGYWLDKALASTNPADNMEKKLYTADGARYAMPGIKEQTGNLYGVKAFINKKWLDKLGLKMPETTEDLKKVLTAFKTQDPNGNGIADEIGITGSTNGWNSIPWHFFVNSFIYDDYSSQLEVDKKGKVKSIFFDNEFKEAMKYLNDLYKNGLYDEQSFTQTESTLRTIAQAEDNTIGIFVGGSPDAVFRGNPERMLDYVALPPLKGPKGVAWAVRSESGATREGLITKYCKHPLAAFRLMDYMLSEEASIFSRYGVEGKDWKPATSKDKCLFENIGAKPKIVSILPYGTVQNSHWQERNVCYRSAEMSDGMAWDGDPYNGEKFKADALAAYIGKGPEKIFGTPSYTQEEMEELTFLEMQIKQQISQEIPKFILGRRNLNEYDRFLEELKGMDFDRYLEIKQSGYDRAHK